MLWGYAVFCLWFLEVVVCRPLLRLSWSATIALLLASSVPPIAFGFAVSLAAVRRAMVAEQAWLAALPFAVDDLFDLLAKDPVDNPSVRIELAPYDAARDAEVLGLLRRDHGTWESNQDGSYTRAFPWTRNLPDINRHKYRWFHQLVERTLRPLPIAKVTIR